MNKNILQKCIDALKNEKPNIDYVLGMLETLVEMSDTPTLASFPTPIPTQVYKAPANHVDEAINEIIPDYLKPGPIGRMIQE